MKPDAWKLYCEAFRALFPSPIVSPDDVVSPAALQEMVDRLGPPLGAGAQCASCGFRYSEHEGHIIPCPRCALEEHKRAARDMSALLTEAEKRSDVLRLLRALRELVVLKDMHDRIENRGNGISAEEAKALNREYRKRRPLAWKRAREVLAAALQAPRPGAERKDDGTHPDWTPWTLEELLTDLESGDYLYLTPTMSAALARMLRASLASPARAPREVTDAQVYPDALQEKRLAIRYADSYEEDRPLIEFINELNALRALRPHVEETK